MKGKILFLAFFVLFSAAYPCSAEEQAVPQKVSAFAHSIEKDLKIWKLESMYPLDETVRQVFAVGGWKLVFQSLRPQNAVDSDPAGPAKAKKFYEAELVLLPLSIQTPKKEILEHLVWQPMPRELFMKVHDLGRNDKFRVFIQADVMTIDIIRTLYEFRGGDSITETLADALNAPASDIFSRREAVARLPNHGNTAIPAIRKAIGNALAENLSLEAHFSALKALRTKEACAELLRAVDVNDRRVSVAALNNLCTAPYPEAAKDLYLKLLSKHERVRECVEALFILQEEKRMLPILKRLRRKPADFAEYFLICSSIYRIETGNIDIAEMHMVGQIKLLMAHSGDIKGTPRIIPISSKTSMREYEFQKEDMRRTKPLEDALVQSPNKDMAIIAVLSLCDFDGSRGQTRFSKDYTVRIRNTGLRILRRMPEKDVRRILDHLKNVRSPELANYFSYIEDAFRSKSSKGIPDRILTSWPEEKPKSKMKK